MLSGFAFSQQLLQLDTLSTRLHSQKDSRFALMVFQESALGNHIGILYFERMGIPVDGSWKIADRFWQDSAWASDVLSFYWCGDGETAIVSTSGVYGSANVFSLNLVNRTSKALINADMLAGADSLQLNVAPMFVIREVNEEKRQLSYTIQSGDSSQACSRDFEILKGHSTFSHMLTTRCY